MDAKRYYCDFFIDDRGNTEARMCPAPDGDYIEFEEYAALQTQLAEEVAINKADGLQIVDLCFKADGYRQKIAALEAQRVEADQLLDNAALITRPDSPMLRSWLKQFGTYKSNDYSAAKPTPRKARKGEPGK